MHNAVEEHLACAMLYMFVWKNILSFLVLIDNIQIEIPFYEQYPRSKYGTLRLHFYSPVRVK